RPKVCVLPESPKTRYRASLAAVPFRQGEPFLDLVREHTSLSLVLDRSAQSSPRFRRRPQGLFLQPWEVSAREPFRLAADFPAFPPSVDKCDRRIMTCLTR